MGNCFLHGNGGVSPLNFRVIGGTSQPSSPRTNDIWVNTSADIANAIFTPVNPGSTTEGRVWFELGLTSASAFSALKGDTLITLCPIDCQQYVSGAWVRKTAKRYTGSAWVDYVRYDTIYNAGDENEPITGGFVSKAWAGAHDETPGTPVITRNSANIAFAMDSGYGAVHTQNKVGVSNYKTLYATGVFNMGAPDGATNSHYQAMRLWSSVSGVYFTTDAVATLFITTDTASKTVAIDLSNISGSYYIGFNMRGKRGGSITLTKMWME